MVVPRERHVGIVTGERRNRIRCGCDVWCDVHPNAFGGNRSVNVRQTRGTARFGEHAGQSKFQITTTTRSRPMEVSHYGRCTGVTARWCLGGDPPTTAAAVRHITFFFFFYGPRIGYTAGRLPTSSGGRCRCRVNNNNNNNASWDESSTGGILPRDTIIATWVRHVEISPIRTQSLSAKINQTINCDSYSHQSNIVMNTTFRI